MISSVALRLLLVVSSACSSAAGRSVPSTPPSPPAAPKQAVPELPAPWRDIDYRATDEELASKFTAMQAADCAGGTYKTDGLCWSTDGRTGHQVITIHFDSPEQARRFTQPWGASVFASVDADAPWQTWYVRAGEHRVAASLSEARSGSTVLLEWIMPLRKTIPWMTSLVGLSHDAVTQKLGRWGSPGRPGCEGILCFFRLPPNESGDVSGSIEFANGVAIRASYVLYCERECALGTAILAAFDTAFGERTTASRPYEETGSSGPITRTHAARASWSSRASTASSGCSCAWVHVTDAAAG